MEQAPKKQFNTQKAHDTMKTKYIPLVALDYMDGATRRTVVELCRKNADHGRLESVMIAGLANGEVVRSSAIVGLQSRWKAFERLAKKMQSRSTPQSFS